MDSIHTGCARHADETVMSVTVAVRQDESVTQQTPAHILGRGHAAIAIAESYSIISLRPPCVWVELCVS